MNLRFFLKNGRRQKKRKTGRSKQHKGVCKKRAILAGQCAIDPRIIKSDFGACDKRKTKKSGEPRGNMYTLNRRSNQDKGVCKKLTNFGDRSGKIDPKKLAL